MKKFSYFLLLPLLLSCSLNSNLNTNTINPLNNSFKIKGSSLIEESELNYNGNWNNLNSSNYSANYMKETNNIIENTNPSLVYSGNWTNYSNGEASGGSFSYTNNETIFQLAPNTSPSITYSNNGWNTYAAFKYNDVNYAPYKYQVSNEETDINKIKYTYNGAYNVAPNSVSPKEEAYSATMHLAWIKRVGVDGNNNSFNYIESKNSTSKIEIPFTGTNIQLYHVKNPQMGQCNVKVYDNNNNLVRDFIINNNDTWKLAKTNINGLPNGNNKLVIQGIDGYRFNFVRAEVLPSIDYKFTGNNIIYYAFTANNCGKVAVTIDNDPNTTEIIDLYDSRNIYQNIYSKKGLGSGEHTITIDALLEKNASSSGYRINLIYFKAIPAISGEFSGKYLNLKLIKNSNYGEANLYIDGIFNQKIDLYSSNSEFFDLELNNLDNKNHTFYLEPANTKNPSSSGTKINFDSYTTSKAEYQFQGISLYYYGTKGPDKGKVDIYLDNEYQGRFDLYSSTEKYKQEIFHITGLTNENHILKIIPSGRKYSASSDYKVNLDYLNIGSTQRIIYSGSDGSNYNIYVSYEDNSSSPLKISTGVGNNTPSIAINGNQAVWTSGANPYNINVGSTTNAFAPIIIGTTNSTQPNPSISQDGSKVTWIQNSGGLHVYTRNSDNSNAAIQISTTSTANKDAIFSPDGSKILWVGTVSGNTKILARNSDASNSPTEISGTILKNLYPSFSNDGNKVVWKGNISGTSYYIYVGNSDGSGTPIKISNKLVNPANGSDYPFFSPDDTKVIYTAIGTGNVAHIYVSNIDATNEIQISNSSTVNKFPSFSPDGSKVVWQGTEGGTSHIYVRNSNGSGSIIKLSDTTTDNVYASFSPDGNKVVWQGKEGGTNHIFVRNADGSGNVEKLTTTTTDNTKPLYEGSKNRYPN